MLLKSLSGGIHCSNVGPGLGHIKAQGRQAGVEQDDEQDDALTLAPTPHKLRYSE